MHFIYLLNLLYTKYLYVLYYKYIIIGLNNIADIYLFPCNAKALWVFCMRCSHCGRPGWYLNIKEQTQVYHVSEFLPHATPISTSMEPHTREIDGFGWYPSYMNPWCHLTLYKQLDPSEMNRSDINESQQDFPTPTIHYWIQEQNNPSYEHGSNQSQDIKTCSTSL